MWHQTLPTKIKGNVDFHLGEFVLWILPGLPKIAYLVAIKILKELIISDSLNSQYE